MCPAKSIGVTEPQKVKDGTIIFDLGGRSKDKIARKIPNVPLGTGRTFFNLVLSDTKFMIENINVDKMTTPRTANAKYIIAATKP